MAPRAVGLGVTQLTFLVSTTLASGLAAGSITALNIAFTILQIPIGVIGVPLGVVVFPSLARELARGATAEYVRLLTRSIRLLLYVMLPLTGLAIVLREQLVALLFDYGRFGERRDRPHGGHAPVLPARPRRAFADRGAGAGVLRRARHADARSLPRSLPWS